MSTRKTDRHAVGALFRAAATGRIALGLRSCGCGNPHTYGPIGGEIDPGEMVIEALAREMREELGTDMRGLPLEKIDVFVKPHFLYTTYLVHVENEFEPEDLNWENEHLAWFSLDDLPANLHPGFRVSVAKPDIMARLR